MTARLCAVYTLRTLRRQPAIHHLVVAMVRDSHLSPLPSPRTADYFLFHFQISHIVISVLGETQTQHIALEVVQSTVGKRDAFCASDTAFGEAQIRRSLFLLSNRTTPSDVPSLGRPPSLPPHLKQRHASNPSQGRPSCLSIREPPLFFRNPRSGWLIILEDAAAFALVYLSRCLQPRIKMPASAGYLGGGWRCGGGLHHC